MMKNLQTFNNYINEMEAPERAPRDLEPGGYRVVIDLKFMNPDLEWGALVKGVGKTLRDAAEFAIGKAWEIKLGENNPIPYSKEGDQRMENLFGEVYDAESELEDAINQIIDSGKLTDSQHFGDHGTDSVADIKIERIPPHRGEQFGGFATNFYERELY